MRQIETSLISEQWRLLEENMGLVGNISHQIVSTNPYYSCNYTYWYEEIFSEGKLGLINAIKSYDDSISKFSTYATHCIRNAIIAFLKKESKHINVNSLDEEFSDENNASLYNLIADSNDEPEEVIVNIILNCLDKREGYTIISRYLLKMKQKAVAPKIGCSQRYVSTLEKQGLENLEKILIQNKPYDKSYYMRKVGSQYMLTIQLDQKDYWQKIRKSIMISPSFSCTRNETGIMIRTEYLDKKFFILLCEIIQILKS